MGQYRVCSTHGSGTVDVHLIPTPRRSYQMDSAFAQWEEKENSTPDEEWAAMQQVVTCTTQPRHILASQTENTSTGPVVTQTLYNLGCEMVSVWKPCSQVMIKSACQ